MKKKILILLFSMIFLTGCSASSDEFMTFDQDINVGSRQILLEQFVPTNLFAKDLCVIPKGTDKDEDGNLTAAANLLVNVDTNSVIYANNVYEKLYPASITKLVTALVAFKYGDLSQTITVSKDAANITEVGAKLCGLKEGDQIVFKDLLTSLLVYSGNDAGIAIADHMSGSEEEFSKLMNEEIKKLGAVNSNFVNAHGLHDDEQYSTAYDIYLVFQELLKYEEFVNIINLSEYRLVYKDVNGQEKTKLFTSTDKYLTGNTKAPDGITVIGGKTGTTNKAGSCLIIASKDQKDITYISLVLRADSSDKLYSQMSYLLKLILK